MTEKPDTGRVIRYLSPDPTELDTEVVYLLGDWQACLISDGPPQEWHVGYWYERADGKRKCAWAIDGVRSKREAVLMCCMFEALSHHPEGGDPWDELRRIVEVLYGGRVFWDSWPTEH